MKSMIRRGSAAETGLAPESSKKSMFSKSDLPDSPSTPVAASVFSPDHANELSAPSIAPNVSGRVVVSILNEEPEAFVGPTLIIHGDIEFTRLLRIDGRVEGKLIAPKTGRLVVGNVGVLFGNIRNMAEVLVDGTIHGDICVKTLVLRGKAVVRGNIKCLSITIGDTCKVCGSLEVVESEEELTTT